MNYKPLVTIIVPIYNRECFLPRCINSLIKQTYSNIEIILIDDGSTDNSLEICKKYTQNDKRIKVISQKNAGVGKARNSGIKEANGTYLCFVDSDDYISLSAIENYIKILNKENYDLIISGFINVDKNENFLFYEKNNEDIDNIGNFWQSFGILLKKNLLKSPVNKIYKRDILIKNKILFSEKTQIAEDALFNVQYYEKINNLYITKEPLYFCSVYTDNNRLTQRFHNTFITSQYNLYTQYINLLKSRNALNKENLEILSKQYYTLLITGFNAEITNTKKFNSKELYEVLIPELSKKHNNLYFNKIEDIIKTKQLENILKILYYNSKRNQILASTQIKTSNKFNQKLYYIIKFFYYTYKYILDKIINKREIKKIEII